MSGSSGDSGPAGLAQLISPAGISIDAVGNVLIADDTANTIRQVNVGTGIITTIAGEADGLDHPSDVTATQGVIYVAEGTSIQKVTP